MIHTFLTICLHIVCWLAWFIAFGASFLQPVLWLDNFGPRPKGWAALLGLALAIMLIALAATILPVVYQIHKS